jgi:hypothetical protein
METRPIDGESEDKDGSLQGIINIAAGNYNIAAGIYTKITAAMDDNSCSLLRGSACYLSITSKLNNTKPTAIQVDRLTWCKAHCRCYQSGNLRHILFPLCCDDLEQCVNATWR